MAGEHVQERKGTKSLLSSGSKLSHWPRQPMNFHFLCLLPLGAGKPFLLHVCENYCFPSISEKINIWVSLQTKYKVASSWRQLLSPCGYWLKSVHKTKVFFSCTLPKCCFFGSNTLSLSALNFPLLQTVLSPAHKWDLETSVSRTPTQKLNYRQDVLLPNCYTKRTSASACMRHT